MLPIEDELKQDEGVRRTPYQDSVGNWACGVGCDLKAHGLLGPDGRPRSMDPWTDKQINLQLDLDIDVAKALVASKLPWARNLDPIRHRVLVNMMFNMGWGDGTRGLSSFKNTLKAIAEGRYEDAARGMRSSKWFGQVKGRGERLAYRMETGRYAPPKGTRP